MPNFNAPLGAIGNSSNGGIGPVNDAIGISSPELEAVKLAGHRASHWYIPCVGILEKRTDLSRVVVQPREAFRFMFSRDDTTEDFIRNITTRAGTGAGAATSVSSASNSDLTKKPLVSAKKSDEVVMKYKEQRPQYQRPVYNSTKPVIDPDNKAERLLYCDKIIDETNQLLNPLWWRF
jgi:hypothetical protein